MKITALIPARSGSRRIPNKNIKLLNGKPLIYYTIAVAKQAGIFERIIVSTDSKRIATLAEGYGAEVSMRPPEFATDSSPEFEWINHLLNELPEKYDCFADLRPTSPFRSVEMIKQAWWIFQDWQPCDSLRAIELVKQHPLKMWLSNKGNFIRPFYGNIIWNHVEQEDPFNYPTQNLPSIYVQNASLEIAHTQTLKRYGNVSGETIMPYFTRGYEGYDINTEIDWMLAELLIEERLAILPEVK